jgi:hypothetical protein
MPKVNSNGQASVMPVLRPLSSRLTALGKLMALLCPVPNGNATGANAGLNGNGNTNALTGGLQPVYCDSYKELVNSWKKAMKWTPGLDCGLSVMLAAASSVKMVGEQLWFKIIGPASSGKTSILEGLAVNSKYVLSKDSIRGFHSGYKTPDGADNSLISRLNGMCLATKDGDTLLKSPNLVQILSEARGIYDRSSRTNYRNAEDKDYVGIRMAWLLCGTAALREIDDSELGARFLDCVIMDTIDDDFEDEVGWRTANREILNLVIESTDDATTQYSPEIVEAMQLTGGYLGYLRENITELASQVIHSENCLRHCARLGKFVAFMRARPARRSDEPGEREFSARLVAQITRLAAFMAIVLNCKTLEGEVMRRVTKIAMDTARGQSLKIADHLAKAEHGMDAASLALLTGYTDHKTKEMLRFLRQIGVCEIIIAPSRYGVKSTQRKWSLTERMRKLYSDVESSD